MSALFIHYMQTMKRSMACIAEMIAQT